MQNYEILKAHCKKIFITGNGNFWYSENEIGNDQRFFYKAGGAMFYFLYSFMTVLEIMAATMGDFPEDEKSDSVSFAVSHTIVMIKIFSIITKKSFIKALNHKMVTVCQNYEEAPLMAEQYRIIKINVFAYTFAVYGACAFFIIEGLRKMFTGRHFVTVVTYYPSFDDDSTMGSFLRVFWTVVLMSMMVTMNICVDFFSIIYIIMYKYKFITLRHYLERLAEEVQNLHSSGEDSLVAEKLQSGLIEGIKMHSNILQLSKEVDKAFGIVMALQLCQTFGSAISILLQIAVSRHQYLYFLFFALVMCANFRTSVYTGLLLKVTHLLVFMISDDITIAAALKLILFVVALFFLLGLFFCNSGEITYQASLIADSFFYCGWHLYSSRINQKSVRNIRQLVVFALMQAQRPLIMKSFKMIELSYRTYLSVIRATYSVVALFYAHKK